jgi:hypothetical protein
LLKEAKEEVVAAKAKYDEALEKLNYKISKNEVTKFIEEKSI